MSSVIRRKHVGQQKHYMFILSFPLLSSHIPLHFNALIRRYHLYLHICLSPALDCEFHGAHCGVSLLLSAHSVETVVGIVDTQYID